MNELAFVHRYVPGKNGSQRVLLLLHGTGGNETDLLPIGARLDPAATLLSVRGNVLENGMPRFFRRFAEGVFDEEDVERRADELADFVTAAAVKYEFDAAQVGAVGYSNGANIAAAMFFLRPDVLSAAVLLRAMVPLSAPPSPSLAGKRILISAGSSDPIVPLENAERLTASFKERGAEVQLDVQPARHGLVQQDFTAAQQWLAR